MHKPWGEIGGHDPRRGGVVENIQHPGFFRRVGPCSLETIAHALGAELVYVKDGVTTVDDLRPLDLASPLHLTFFASRKHTDKLATTRAGACLINHRDAELVPGGTTIMLVDAPHRAFVRAIGLIYPEALQPKVAARAANAEGNLVDPSAEIEEGVTIEPGAIIGREARIRSGTIITAGAIVGYRTFIRRDCFIGPGVSVTHVLIGDRVTLHAGVRIGQDGFGYVPGTEGHLKCRKSAEL